MAQSKIPESAKQIDRHVGMKLRLLRLNAKMSQTELGNALGLTFQQVQKYERGANRIGGSRLWQICEIFNAEPNFFFEGLEGAGSKIKPTQNDINRKMLKRQNFNLLQSFDKIHDEEAQSAIIRLCETFSEKG